MAVTESVVKSIRIPTSLYEEANEIFKKEGFSFAEVIRLVCEATVKEDRIPRGLSTKELETKLDESQMRESYIDSILGMAGIVSKHDRGLTAEERLLKSIFNENKASSDMSNREVREWAKKWGLPDDLSVATLADLHDCGLFPEDPWSGDYTTNIYPVKAGSREPDETMQNVMIIMAMQNNLTDNLEKVKKKLQAKAVNYLMQMDNAEEEE